MGNPNKKNNRPVREVKEFEEEVIQVDRVTRVVKGGRRLRFRATVVIGDRKGRVSYGIGKASEVQAAIQKAVSKAKKRMIRVPIYNGTIPNEARVKFKAAEVLIKPASEGTGIIAGGPVRKIMDLAGIKNVLSKSLGARNRLNVTKVTFLALMKLRIRPELEEGEKKKEHEASEQRSVPQVKQITRKDAKAQSHAHQTTHKKETPKKTK